MIVHLPYKSIMNERLRKVRNHPLVFTAIVDLECVLSDAVRDQVVGDLVVGHTTSRKRFED